MDKEKVCWSVSLIQRKYFLRGTEGGDGDSLTGGRFTHILEKRILKVYLVRLLATLNLNK